MLKSAGASRRQSIVGGGGVRRHSSDDEDDDFYYGGGQTGEGAAAAALELAMPSRARSQSMHVDVLSWRNQAIISRMQENVALPSVKHV